MLTKGRRALLQRAGSLLRNRSGVAAVEFAIILPLMLLMYIGVVDATRGVIASRKLNLLSRTVSDLVSQQPTALPVSIAKLSTILGSATSIMRPFPVASLTLTVSAVDIRAKSDKTCCDAVVRWSYTQAGATSYLRSCTTPLTLVTATPPLPTNFPQEIVNATNASGYTSYSTGAQSYMIVTDATYTYTPMFSQAAAWFTTAMRKTTFMVPRAQSNPVTIADPSTASAPQMGKVCFS